MGVVPFAVGTVCAVIALGALTAGAVALRRAVVPRLDTAAARLAEIVIVVVTLTVVAELVGAVGLLDLVPVTVACVAVGTVMAVVGARRSRDQVISPLVPTVPADPWAVAGAAVVAVVALGRCLAATRVVLGKGMYSFDTLFYHGPFAARFVQERSTAGIHHVIPGEVVTFHPATSELLDALGIVAFGSDVLTPLLNLLWLALAMFAAWCVGSRWRAGPVAVAAVGLLFGVPGLVASQAGSGYNDTAGLAMVLAAVAFSSAATPIPVPGRSSAWPREPPSASSCRWSPRPWPASPRC